MPSEIGLLDLHKRCREELEKFSRHEPSEDRFCLDIFRRALVLRDEQAWQILTQQFSPTILGWLRRHPYREGAYRLHNEEDYVALTIERLWMVTVHNQALEFNSLAGAIKFLRISLNSAVIDALRSQGKDTSISEPNFEEPAAPSEETNDELWESIQSMLSDPRERRLAYLLFVCNLKPRLVVQLCAREFSDVQEIFRMKRSILDRLRRNKDRLRWLLGDVDI